MSILKRTSKDVLFLCVNSEPGACKHAQLKKGYKRVPACRAKRLYPFLDASAFADAFGERRINAQLRCESEVIEELFRNCVTNKNGI